MKKLFLLPLTMTASCSLFESKEDVITIPVVKERLPFVEGGSFTEANGDLHECPSPGGTCTGEVPPHCHSSAAKCPLKK